MPGELSSSRELLAAALLVVQVGAVALTAAVATARLIGRDLLLRGLTWVLLCLAQAVGVPLLLGMVGLLRLPAVVAAHVAVAIAALVLHRRSAPAPSPRDPATTPPGLWSLLDAAAVSATTLYLVLGARLSLNPHRSTEFDTKEYHLANLASWLQTGNIWRLPYAQPGSMTANHPSSGEVFGLWLALPTHGDELVYLAPLAFGLLAVLAGAVLGRELYPDRSCAALGALGTVAVLTAPIYFAQVDTLLTDLISAASVMTAVAFLVLAWRAAAPSPALVGLAGVALGLGLGSKYTALLPGLAVAAVAVVVLRRSKVWLWLIPGVVLLAAPWFIRNLITTGNPLFPQPVGPLAGARSPYDVLDTSLLDQLVGRESAILRRTASLARTAIGPLLVLIVAGVLGPLLPVVRARGRAAAPWVAGGAVIALAMYAATPYTGGGPTGLAFIIVSCFRYAMIGVLLAAATGVALAGRWVGGAAVAVTLAWNLWKIVDTVQERGELDVTVRAFAVAVAVTALAVVSAQLLALRPELVRRVPAAALAATLAVVGVAGGFAAFHRLDRGRTPSTLEATLLALGADRPAVVIGVADLRAVLGPRLERRLVKVSRGGAAEEIPFADEAQLRRRILGEDTAPPPAELAPALDRAIAAAGPDVLVVGSISPVGYPDGWRPADDWCLAGGDGEGIVFVRPSLLPPGVPCTPAPEL